MATVDEQLTIINTRAFFTALAQQVKTIHGALQTNNVTMEGGWIGIVVNDVTVKYSYTDDQTISFKIGSDGSGNPVRAFAVPTSWLVT